MDSTHCSFLSLLVNLYRSHISMQVQNGIIALEVLHACTMTSIGRENQVEVVTFMLRIESALKTKVDGVNK